MNADTNWHVAVYKPHPAYYCIRRRIGSGEGEYEFLREQEKPGAKGSKPPKNPESPQVVLVASVGTIRLFSTLAHAEANVPKNVPNVLGKDSTWTWYPPIITLP